MTTCFFGNSNYQWDSYVLFFSSIFNCTWRNEIFILSSSQWGLGMGRGASQYKLCEDLASSDFGAWAKSLLSIGRPRAELAGLKKASYLFFIFLHKTVVNHFYLLMGGWHKTEWSQAEKEENSFLFFFLQSLYCFSCSTLSCDFKIEDVNVLSNFYMSVMYEAAKRQGHN